MKNKFLVLISLVLIFLAVSCSTTENTVSISSREFEQLTFEKQLATVFERYAEYKGTVFMGISGPYRNQDTAYEVAAENCAQMAAINQALALSSMNEILVNDQRGIDSFKTFSSAVFDNDQLMKIADEIEIIDIVWYGGKIGAVVFGRYNNPTPTTIDTTGWSETKWPVVSEGVAAVGGTNSYHYIQDSLEAAAYQAAVQIAEAHNRTVTAVDDAIDMDLDNMVVNSHQVNFNILTNFRILEYAYDPETNRYSALAITD